MKRSIPACAGEPSTGSAASSKHWVYPRVCGGTTVCSNCAGKIPGLSPRVRGNPDQRDHPAGLQGSIPACAGEPYPGHQCAEYQWVYPRVCGGTMVLSGSNRPSRGLSPRVRGNRRFLPHCVQAFGSIPACAGEPYRWPPLPSSGAVYPRVCGGTPNWSWPSSRLAGLSPRVRGNPLANLLGGGRRGSIPACAGEPRRGPARVVPPAVYPRVCGGTLSRSERWEMKSGLSPRVRGNPPKISPFGSRRWSIPACAGEPPGPRGRATAGPVYPRVCGGTHSTPMDTTRQPGLSPRVRGNPIEAARDRAEVGSIPACAGEPYTAR